MEWEPQRPSAPSTPSSMSSQSTGTSGARSEKIPTLKQISQSPSVSALSKLTDDELRRKGIEDLLRILRRVEADYKSLLGEHGNIVKDVNRRFQIFVLDTRNLKEVNQKLQDDNQELRDLCCFLDDDRQRGRKLAREWQRFGRYTASVMRSEVAVYQEKLKDLEDRQTELITENMELKELCLYLDQERVRMTGDRDEGDGSSNGTMTGHEDGIVAMETNRSTTPTPSAQVAVNYPSTPSSSASYIRELELKVRKLEEEKNQLAQKMNKRNSSEGPNNLLSTSDGAVGDTSILSTGNDQSVHGSVTGAIGLRKSPVSSKPEAVVHAMKVLQVHEELEKSPTEEEDLDDPEKAIVREMCNVVWRKLGDTGDVGTFNDSSDCILDPPYVPDSPVKTNMAMKGQAQSYSISQPQPQMASTPLFPGRPDQIAEGPSSHQFHPQRQERHHPLMPPQESNQPPIHSSQPSNQHPFSHNQSDTGVRSRQGSMSERLSAEERNLPFKQAAERSEDRRTNPEQSYPPHSVDTSGKPLHQQQTSQYQRQPFSHQQQPQQQQPSNQQQNMPLHPPPSQRSSDLISRTLNHPPHYNQRTAPSQHPPPSVMPRNQNQRPADPAQRPNPPQTGHPYPQRGEPASSANAIAHQQQQRGPQAYTDHPVKLLDAPGAYNYAGGDGGGPAFQRQAPAQHSFMSKRDRPREEPGYYAQARPLSRQENAHESSAERETQGRAAARSFSSSSALNQPASQIPAQNIPPAVSQQNLKGPGGFRAYPPQLTSMPTQPVSWQGARGQEPVSISNSYQQNPVSKGNPYQQDPPRTNYNPGTAPQGRSNTSKRFQEQEWRQTYLDDSDTL